MKILGILFYLLANIYLGIYYTIDIIKYYSSKFNYDGFRYIIPIAIADLILIVSLVILYFANGLNRQFYILGVLVLLHNVNMGIGVERIPFVGILLILVSIFYCAKYFLNK